MEKHDIRQADFDKIQNMVDVDYISDGIAFHSDIREIPMDEMPIRINMFVIVACMKGRLLVELNTQAYTLQQNDILVCRPNDVIVSCMLSPDLNGFVFCLSHKGVAERMSDRGLWDRAFQFVGKPVVRASTDSLHMFSLYGAALTAKIRMERTPFHEEIIDSIIRAALYELIANVDSNKPLPCGGQLVKQREVLFKRFMDLLSTTRIKPRCVTWYARQLYVTPKYLSTVSKQVSGKTAFEWINEYVSVDIRFWLKNSDKTIKEIANMLEFPNISFFGKYCRAHFGLSPTEYRRQLRGHSATEA